MNIRQRLNIAEDLNKFKDIKIEKLEKEKIDLQREIFWLTKMFEDNSIRRVILCNSNHIWVPVGPAGDQIVKDLDRNLGPQLSVSKDRLRSWPAAENYKRNNNNNDNNKNFFF